MMMTRTNKEYAAKWQPSAGMHGVVCLGLSLSPVNIFNGNLGQQATQSIDSRHIRH
jgi:hypothetical protein